MTKEQIYAEQMKALGIYEEAFEPEIHTLAIMERELTRALKAWKAASPGGANPSILSPYFKEIVALRRDILAHRDALGLTPKALQRLKGKTAIEISGGTVADPLSQRLDALLDKVTAYE